MERKVTEKALELSQQTLYELDAIQEFLDAGALVGKTEDETSKLIKICFHSDAAKFFSFWSSNASCTACFDYALSQMRKELDGHKSPNLAELSKRYSLAQPTRLNHPMNRASRRAVRNTR